MSLSTVLFGMTANAASLDDKPDETLDEVEVFDELEAGEEAAENRRGKRRGNSQRSGARSNAGSRVHPAGPGQGRASTGGPSERPGANSGAEAMY